LGTATTKGSSYSGAIGQAGVGEGLGHDRAVELAGAQHLEQLDGEVLLQHQRHLRRHVDGVAHQVRQQVGADGVDDAQAQRAVERVLAALGDLLDGRGLLDHALRLPHDGLAQRRDAHLVGAALEDLDVELLLELLDRHAERGLRHEARFGRAPEMLLAGDGNDVAEFRQRHGAGKDSAAVPCRDTPSPTARHFAPGACRPGRAAPKLRPAACAAQREMR
jgi:hypothetical protein